MSITLKCLTFAVKPNLTNAASLKTLWLHMIFAIGQNLLNFADLQLVVLSREMSQYMQSQRMLHRHIQE